MPFLLGVAYGIYLYTRIR